MFVAEHVTRKKVNGLFADSGADFLDALAGEAVVANGSLPGGATDDERPAVE